jgi:nucleotide-binding universal stress UspA family protein
VGTIIVGTDGSELATQAASTGLALLRGTDTVLVVTVVEGTDPSLMEDASGHVAPTMGPEEYVRLRDRLLAAGLDDVKRTAAALGRDAETRVIEGSPGVALCTLADEVSADAIVIGSRGRGGLRRAFLGSVSDHVVRNASCPVVTVRVHQSDEE